MYRMLITEGELRGLIVAVKILETIEEDERVKDEEELLKRECCEKGVFPGGSSHFWGQPQMA